MVECTGGSKGNPISAPINSSQRSRRAAMVKVKRGGGCCASRGTKVTKVKEVEVGPAGTGRLPHNYRTDNQGVSHEAPTDHRFCEPDIADEHRHGCTGNAASAR